ncbi:MAG: ATP-binding cassette domain-containing protein [Pseudomonadota bacterium]
MKLDNKSPVIEVNDLTTLYGDEVIHKRLNLTIYENEVLAIVGGSGAGKTTLLRAILLLHKATGSIKVYGNEIIADPHANLTRVRKLWGVMFQQGALFSSLTVLDNVAFPLFEYTRLDKKSVYEIAKLKIALVGLTLDSANKYPAELSGGMQKRLALARAIALDPLLLFLDEPTAGLDPKGASSLDALVLDLKQNLGLTVIMVTHDLDSLWRVSDRVAFLGEKKVLEVAPIEHLYQSKNPLIKDYFSNQRAQIIRENIT